MKRGACNRRATDSICVKVYIEIILFKLFVIPGKRIYHTDCRL